MRKCYTIIASFLVTIISSSPLVAQNDEEYGSKIREYTTDPRYLNEMVDHLPISDSVPSPLEHFGTIIGAPGILHYTHEIYGYMRAVAAATGRVEVRNIGMTEEDREMIAVFVASEETISNLETYRSYLNKLADPRKIDKENAREIEAKAKPIYLFTGGLHSPETGSPEMLMELVYRLAVEESQLINAIRENVIVVIIPVAEPDGRDRMVDIYNYRKDHEDVGPGLLYWGHYVAHDNNRDGYGLGLALTRNILNLFLDWKPTITHDLHESVPYLYVSTGTGPYNEYIDPITVDEWHNLSHEEVTELTRRGMPGVWTHGFYTGWAANYLIWIANTRNSIGRFYETFGNSIAETKERKLGENSTTRRWYRPNPPLEKTKWSLRNNTNYMQSGTLVALNYVARNRKKFVENFYIKSKNSVRRGKEEKPHAFVFPREQQRPFAAIQLINLLRDQGLEVHVAQEKLEWELQAAKEVGDNGKSNQQNEKPRTQSTPKGSYLVRLDQPYRTLALVLLDRQNFPKDEQPPYDDTGWTLPFLWQVKAHRVEDKAILDAKMELVSEPVEMEGKVERKSRAVFLLNNTTDDQFAVFRFRLPEIDMKAAEESFEMDDKVYRSGSIIIDLKESRDEDRDKIETVAQELGLTLFGVNKLPDVRMHDLDVPRIALVHTWVSTPQDAGWWRLAFDKIGIPYTYISEQDLGSLDSNQFDVIIMPRTRASTQRLVSGNSMAGKPIPWKNTPEYRHIGIIDETDDIREGMGDAGIQNLRQFISSGGVFITEGTTSGFPIDLGITRRIGIRRTQKLQARGTIVRATATKFRSPIMYGYSDTVSVYFNQAPVFRIDTNLTSFRLPDWLKDEIWQKEMPQSVLNFAKKDILMSGMLSGESELTGTPAIVDVPVDQGHVILFGIRPFWRWETRGSHGFVFNTLLHWNDLRAGWPERAKEEEQEEEDSLYGEVYDWKGGY